jgi:PhnB protein
MNPPTDYTPVTPYLAVNDAAKAIEFYKAAFNAEERLRLDDKKTGKIGHAEISIRGQVIMLADEYPGMNTSPTTLGGASTCFALMVSDCDAAYQQAVAAGATSVRPPSDAFYGHRTAMVTDPFGHPWSFQQELEKQSAEETQRRWDEMGGSCDSSSAA